MKDQWDFNISYNTIINNDGGGVNTVAVLRGIWLNASSLRASGTINNNTITLKFGGTTTNVSAIENGAGGTAASNTININNNIIQNCTNPSVTTGVWYGIWNNAASCSNLNINNNTFLNNTTIATSGSVYLIYNNGNVPSSVNINNNNLSLNWTTATSGTLYGIYNTTATGSVNINNNSFANLTRPGTGPANLIYNTAAATGIGLSISNNTWTNLSLATTGSVYFIYNSNSTQNMTINNNAIVGTFTKTGAGGTVWGYYDFGSPGGGTATLSNNKFSNITLSGATIFYGIQHYTSTSQKMLFLNDTISNITGGSSAMYGIFQGYGAAGSEVSGNVVSNWTGSSTMYGIQVGNTSAPLGLNVYNNVVTGLISTGAVTIYGISSNLGTLNRIYQNRVYNIEVNNASGIVYGIYHGGGTLSYIYNNFVSDLRTPIATGANAIAGIYISGGTTVNAYYNTVYLNATSTGATFGSSGLYKSSTTNSDIRNNIIINKSSYGATSGFNVAFRWSGAYNATYYNALSNNNDFYAGSPSAKNLIFYDGTNSDQTIAAFQARVVGRDAFSFSEATTPFVNISSTPYNLHLNTTSSTQCESGGQVIAAYATDFDGDTRSATYTDVGADEGNFVINDLFGPTITYTPVTNTGYPFNNLVATITDPSGVPNSGGPEMPVIYWKIVNPGFTLATSTNPWQASTSNFMSGSQYSFDFGNTAAVGDTVYYYVMAQDIFGNVSANPSTGIGTMTATPPLASTNPTTLFKYIQCQAISGTYTIDITNATGGLNFQTFTEAVNFLNTGGLVGPVIFNVMTDQTWPMTIGTAGGSALAITNLTTNATNNVVFQKFGTGVNPILSVTGNSGQEAAIWINASDYINFNGIDIVDAGTSTTNWLDYGLHLKGSATDGCNYITYKNAVIDLNRNNTASRGIRLDGTTATAISGSNNYNKFYNNIIQDVAQGYNFYGTSTVINKGNEVGNETGGISKVQGVSFLASTASAIGVYSNYQDSMKVFNTTFDTILGSYATYPTTVGIFMLNNSNIQVYGNTIRKITTNAGDPVGINFENNLGGINSIYNNTLTEITALVSGNINSMRLYSGSSQTMNVYGNEIKGLLNAGSGEIVGIYCGIGSSIFNVYKNNLHDFNNTGASANSILAMALTGASSTYNAYNNMIYDLRAPLTTGTAPAVKGIRAENGNCNLYYNTVLLNYVSTGASNTSAAIWGYAAAVLDMRNNIFANNCDMTIGTRAAALWYNSTTYTNIAATCNNNIYYGGAISAKNLIFYDGTNSDQLLSSYKTRMATKDQGSFTELPPFMSSVTPYNVHLLPSVSTTAESGGQAISGYTTDFDGNTRNVSTPDIGADEFTGTPAAPMAYVSSTIVQSASPYYAMKSTTNNQIIGIQVVTNGPLAPINLTDLTLNTAGTALPSDFKNAKIFYTYNSPVFSTATQFGTTVAIPSGAFTVTGSQALQPGTNYFWLTYDVTDTAINGRTLDATCTSIKIAAVDYTPALTDPAGNRVILSSLTGTYTIDNSMPTGGINFNSFTEAVTAMNACTINGAVIFNVNPGLTSTYTGSYTLTNNTTSSALNTITIKSSLADSTAITLNYAATGTADNFIFNLNGARYITIKGLKMQNTGATYSNAILLNNTATYNTIQANHFVGLSGTAGTNDLNRTLIRDADVNSSYLLIKGNRFQSASAAISLYGNSTTQLNGIEIRNNNIVDFATYGIDASYTRSMIVDSNYIASSFAVTAGSKAGLNLNYMYDSLKITKNTILLTNMSGSVTTYGIYWAQVNNSATTKPLVANNMISMTGTATSGVYALRFYPTSNVKIFYNSIYVSGNTSYDVRSINLAGTVGPGHEVMNNIFQSNLSPIVVEASGSLTSCDYNVYYTPAVSGNVYNYANIWYTNYTAFKNAMGASYNQNCLTVNPQFINTSTNLHVKISNIAINGKATPIAAISTDIDGNVRNATTPDIGADEFLPLYNDAGISAIPSLAGNCPNSLLDVKVRLKNEGISNLTTATINWQLNGVTQTPYSFTGSVVNAADILITIGQFTILANTNYTIKTWSSLPNGAADTNNTNDTLQISNLYAAIAAGTYSVYNGAVAPDYNNLTSAVNDLKLKGICGPVIISINDSTFYGNYDLTSIAGASATNTITFTSTSNDSTKVLLTYASATAADNFIFKLNGAKYVTIKKLKFQNTGATYNNAITITNSATNNSLESNYLVAAPGTLGTNSGANSNLISLIDPNSHFNKITGNNLVGASFGIYTGGNATTRLNNIEIRKNIITDFGCNGIYATYMNSMIVDSNSIVSSLAMTTGTVTGMYIQYTYDSTRITKNTVNIYNLSSSVNGMSINWNTNTWTTGAKPLIANNMLSLQNAGTGQAYVLRLYPSNNLRIYNNSIYVDGANTGGDVRAINIAAGSGIGHEIINNSMQSNKKLIWNEVAGTISVCNYNNYYTLNTANPYGYLGTTTQFATFAAWKAGTGLDVNSISVNPMYLSVNDLHVSQFSLLNSNGTSLSSVTTDMDGNLRNATTPDIGADEFDPIPDDAGIVEIPTITGLCPNTFVTMNVKLKNLGLNVLTSATVNWTLNGILQTPHSYTGNLASGTTSATINLGDFVMAASTPYSISVWTDLPNGQIDLNTANDTMSVNNVYAAMAGGIYTVGGTSPDFADVTAAVNAVSSQGICGPIVFNLRPGFYTGQYTINNIAGSSATNTVTFKSEDNDSNLVILQNTSVSATNYIFNLNSCSNIIIKGLTIKALDATYANLITLTGTLSNISIQSNKLEGTQTINTDDNQVLIRCNTLNQIIGLNLLSNRMNYGRMAINFLSTVASTNVVMKYNYMYNQLARPMNLNRIQALDFGYNQLFSDASITTNGGIFTTNLTGQWKFYNNSLVNLGGIRVWEGWVYGGIGVGQEALVYNNYLQGNSTSSYVYDGGGSVTNVKFYHNTFVGYTTGAVVLNFNNYYGCNNAITFKNNLIYSYSTGKLLHTTPSATSGSPICSSNFSNYSFDYNDYYTTGATLATFNGTTCANLAALQTATGQESHSVSINPQLVASGDAHITNFSLVGTGTSVPEVTTDLYGNSRTSFPTIGAHELALLTVDMSANAMPLPTNAAGCYTNAETITITVKNNGISTIDFAVTPLTVTTNVTGQAYNTLTGIISTGSLAPNTTMAVPMGSTLDMSSPGTYTFRAYTTVSGDGFAGNDTMAAVNRIKVALLQGSISGTPTTLCFSGAPTFALTGSTGGNIQWKSSTASITGPWNNVGTNSTTFAPGVVNATTYYKADVSCDLTTLATNVVTVNVNAPAVATTTPASSCVAGALNLAATASSGSLAWYAAATGGSVLGTGTSFTTPVISTTTSYYVDAEIGANVSSTVTLGSGTTTTSTMGNTPYSSYFEGSREQYLVTASELTALGLISGNITSLAFNVVTSGAYVQNNFTIKMAHTANTALTGAYGTPSGSFTTVYSIPSLAIPATGWNTYSFATPFVWDGVSNVIIDICHDNDINSSCSVCYGTSSTVYYTATSFNSCYGSYGDNVQSCGVTSTSTLSSTYYTYRPNMKFTGLSNGICASPRQEVIATIAPPAVGGTAIGSQTVCSNSLPSDLTLTGNNCNVVNWQKSTDIAFTSPVTINSTSTTLTGALMGMVTTTTYFRAHVQNSCGVDAYSSAVTLTVYTPPTLDATDNIAPNSARIHWTSTATGFEVEYGPYPYTFTGFANATGITNSFYTIFSLNQITTYQYKVRATCAGGGYSDWSTTGQFTTTTNATPGLWIGAVSTDWNNIANWSDATIPTSLVNVVIPAAAVYQPAVTSAVSSPAVCNNLTINSGSSLTIDAGKALTVNGTLTNNNGSAALILKSSVAGTGSLLHATAAVNGTVERYIPHTNTEEYHMLASPVASQAIAPNFNQLDGFYVWNEAAGEWVEFANAGFTAVNGGSNFVPGIGYAVSYPAVTTKSFVGALNQGSVNIPLSVSTGMYAGWNFVANPYPSSINWDAASGWSRIDLDDAGGGENAMWIWNASLGNYGSYISNAGVGTGTNDVTSDVAIAQGFWVKALTSGSLGMSNDVRAHSSHAFLKSTSTTDRVRLTVSSTSNTYSDEVIVKFGNQNDLGGAQKMFSMDATAPSLYTKKSNKNWSIDYLTTVAQHSIVPLNFKAGVNGNYTIKASELNSFTTSTYVYLKDLANNSITDLNQNSNYSFAATTNDNANRFQLLFALSPLGITNTGIQNTSIYANNNKIYINSNEAIQNIAIYNTLGQLIKTVANNSGTISVDMKDNAMGYYIVKIVTNKNVYSEKVLVK
ncbi:MAG: BNR-repeat neuraminidase N-terminal domain-containing protein [Bacteroidales bacterium]